MPDAGRDYKSQVLGAVDIVELIGRVVALKRRGKSYVGLCPFHQEKTPSFTVNPTRQCFYCFGCKAAGNAIDFVMKRDRIEFINALKLLGEQAGIEMPRLGASRQKTGERQVLLDVQSAACAFFEKSLAHPQLGSAAREYISSRHVTAESVRRFQLGYAPDSWDALLKGPVGHKFGAQQLVLGGLAKIREQGGYYDTFRNRLMFPIRDETGRVIAFGGRVMPGSQDPAKYLNSPETPLFSKGRCIFGLDLAKQKTVETRTAIVVEGYMDVIAAHQLGLSNVVSVLGTAMTPQHVTTLRRFADRIVLLFDADAAGEVAVDRAVGLFLSQPVEIAIAQMPTGVDPDQYLFQNGAEAFSRVIDGAVDALAYKWKQLVGQFNATGQSLTGQQKAVETYLQMLASARGAGPVDSLRWGAALARVSRLIDVPVSELHRRFAGRRTLSASSRSASVPAAEAPPAPKSASGLPSAQATTELRLLGVLLLHPDRWAKVQQAVHLEDFVEDGRRRLAEFYWQHQRDEGEPVFNEFLGYLRDPELVELAIQAADEVETLTAAPDGRIDADAILREAFEFLEQARRVREENRLLAEARRQNQQDVDDQLELLKKLQEQRRHPDLRRVM